MDEEENRGSSIDVLADEYKESYIKMEKTMKNYLSIFICV